MINLDRYIFLVMVVGSFFLGIHYESLSIKSDKLKDLQATNTIEEERNKAADEVAQKVLGGLTQWKQNTETIVKEMHFETTKPVFYNVCLTDNYVSLFNEKQRQSRATLADKSEREVQN